MNAATPMPGRGTPHPFLAESPKRLPIEGDKMSGSGRLPGAGHPDKTLNVETRVINAEAAR